MQGQELGNIRTNNYNNYSFTYLSVSDIYPFLIGSKKIRISSPFNIHTVCVLWMQVKLIDETYLTAILAFLPNKYSAIYFIFLGRLAGLNLLIRLLNVSAKY